MNDGKIPNINYKKIHTKTNKSKQLNGLRAERKRLKVKTEKNIRQSLG